MFATWLKLKKPEKLLQRMEYAGCISQGFTHISEFQEPFLQADSAQEHCLTKDSAMFAGRMPHFAAAKPAATSTPRLKKIPLTDVPSGGDGQKGTFRLSGGTGNGYR